VRVGCETVLLRSHGEIGKAGDQKHAFVRFQESEILKGCAAGGGLHF